MALPDHPIATGATAEIYTWRDGWVLKLFKQGISRQTVAYEAEISRIVHATGLPVPAVGEVLEINGRFGLELERVDGISMLEALIRKPWKYGVYAHQLAELQAEMHTRRVAKLPAQSERLRQKIMDAEKLPEELRIAALNAWEGIPRDDQLCHGDFHPGNIQLAQHGPVIIDWIDATRGSPLLDVTRSTLLFSGIQLPSDFPGGRQLNLIIPRFYHAYRKRYFELNPLDPQEMEKWLPLLAAARLEENIQFDEKRLLTIAQQLVSTGNNEEGREY